MTNQEAIEEIKSRVSATEYVGSSYVDCEDLEALKLAISALKAQEETVSRKVYEQISWERDIAVMQLKDLGYGLGEKIRTDGDTISRQAAIGAVRKCSVKEVTPAFMLVDKAEVMTELMMLPPAQSELATDYISKQSVIDAITDENIIRNMDSAMDSEMHRVKRSVHRIIASIPSAQPEPCEDAVSRQAVLDLIADYDLSMGQVVNCIHALQSVTPKGKWIPCIERLPEEGCEFLCCDARREIIIGLPYADEEAYTGFSAESETEYIFNCVAWMPLPEPYRKEGE